MSYILDALKKSESDRQRQSGPALFEVKLAQPRHLLPNWALGLIAVLVISLGVLGWMLIRRNASNAVVASAAAVSPGSAAGAPASSGGALPAPANPAPRMGAPGASGVSPTAAPGAPGAEGETHPATSVNRGTVAADAGENTAPGGAAAGGAAAGDGAPEDETPAVEPPPAGPFKSRVRHASAAGLPLYPDGPGAQAAGMPVLRLDLHVFAAQPQERFALINMHRLREGDTLPEGAGLTLDSITPEGAVIARGGERFLLPKN